MKPLKLVLGGRDDKNVTAKKEDDKKDVHDSEVSPPSKEETPGRKEPNKGLFRTKGSDSARGDHPEPDLKATSPRTEESRGWFGAKKKQETPDSSKKDESMSLGEKSIDEAGKRKVEDEKDKKRGFFNSSSKDTPTKTPVAEDEKRKGSIFASKDGGEIEDEKKKGGLFKRKEDSKKEEVSPDKVPTLSVTEEPEKRSGGFFGMLKKDEKVSPRDENEKEKRKEEEKERKKEEAAAKKEASLRKKRHGTVTLVNVEAKARSIGSDGIVHLVPEVLRIWPIGVERSPSNTRIQNEWTLFLSFGWRGKTSKGKDTKVGETRTATKPKPWDFWDCAPSVFPLGAKRGSFFVELWAFGRVRNTLEGSIDLPLDALKTMVGEVEVQRDFWLTLLNDKGEPAADVRVALEFGRSDATMLTHINEGLFRLAAAERGDVKTTELWPQAEGMLAPVKMASRMMSRTKTMVGGSLPKLAGITPKEPEQGNAASSAQSQAAEVSSVSEDERIPSSPPPATSGATTDGECEDSDEDQPEDEPESDLFAGLSNNYFADTSSADGYSGPLHVPGSSSDGYTNPYEQKAEHFDDGADSSSSDGDLPLPTPVMMKKPVAPELKQDTIVTSEMDLRFNDEWQQAVETLIKEDASTLDVTYQNLSDLSRKFVAVAQTYGRIIVRELHLPVERKIVQPMKLGGIIGGDKYVVAGILFKVARPGLFNSDEPAAKVAGHELKCLTALFNANYIHKLGFALPMIALIDVLGHRLIALALCPLNRNTLIHGSADAGITILSGGDAEDSLKSAASRLNLKVHTVNKHIIPLAVDCEVHRGTDGRMYAIDLSRVLPPEHPNRDIHLSHLFRMLRPELVRSNPVPLCSDAASAFVAKEDARSEHTHEILEATQRLRRLVIPWAAISLDQLHTARSDPDWKFFRLDHVHRLLHVVHCLGVNCRYLLEIRSHSRTRVSRQLLMVEVVARGVKKQIRRIQRRALELCNGVHDVMVTRNMVEFLNDLLSLHDSARERSAKVWDDMAKDLQAYFGAIEIGGWTGEQLRDYMLEIPLGLLLVFQRTNEQLGLQWSARVQQLIEESVQWLEKQEEARETVKTGILVGAVLDTAWALKGIGKAATGVAGTIFRTNQAKRTVSNQAIAKSGEIEPIPFGATGSGSTLDESAQSIVPIADPNVPVTSSPDQVPSAAGYAAQPQKAKQNSGAVAAGGAPDQVVGGKSELSHNPWFFWTKTSRSLFFEDDLLDVGSRIKLNNQAAMAQGYKLVKMSEEASDENLKAHFRLLASKFFDSALMSNPSNPSTLRMQAKLLLQQEAYRLHVHDLSAPGCMSAHFWGSTLRYIDFLYKVALDSDPNDAEALYDYSCFLQSGGQDRKKQCFMVLRSVLAWHDNETTKDKLSTMLQELGLQKDYQLLNLWRKRTARVTV